MLLVANEFLDALPIRQHVGGIERRVRTAAGGLAFDRDGEIVETSPERDEAVASIANHLLSNGGVALFIDYGHSTSGPGDTLQAVSRHGFAPVLASPGEQDLTAHVDFETVARVASEVGASVTPLVPQGEWLSRLGIGQRAAAVGNCPSAARAGDRRRRSAPYRRRSDGCAIQGYRDPFAGLAGALGV